MNNQKEQLPLLWESDEESHFTCPRKHRNLYYSRNPKSKIKGAALIIKNWPDHISSLLAYWWIGFIMIAITIFIIYSSLSIIDVAVPSRIPFVAADSSTDENLLNVEENFPFNVNMHVFVNNYDDINDDFYLKYVKRLAKRFTDYKYNIIVVLNDTIKPAEKDIKDSIKNEIAMRTVLKTNNLYQNEYWSDISVQHILLSKYLDNSPVKESWRELPTYTIPFLIRCISIWNKGGIAFDPNIIIPPFKNRDNSQNLYDILKKYKNKKTKIKITEDENILQEKPKINNIQDIIRLMENDKSKVAHIPQYNLSEAENKEEISFISIQDSETKKDEHKKEKREVTNNSSYIRERIVSGTEYTENKTVINSQELEYFKNHPKLFYEPRDAYKESDDSNNQLSLIRPDNILMMDYNNQLPELTIHLKGTIIATSVSCHAFLGTVFSNIKHYAINDTIEHIITDEISLFCKGDGSSCRYIDLIS